MDTGISEHIQGLPPDPHVSSQLQAGPLFTLNNVQCLLLPNTSHQNQGSCRVAPPDNLLVLIRACDALHTWLSKLMRTNHRSSQSRSRSPQSDCPPSTFHPRPRLGSFCWSLPQPIPQEGPRKYGTAPNKTSTWLSICS